MFTYGIDIKNVDFGEYLLNGPKAHLHFIKIPNTLHSLQHFSHSLHNFLKSKNGSFVGDFASLFLPIKFKCEFKKKTKVNFSLLLLLLLSKPIYSWFSFALGFRGFHFLAHLL